MIDQNVWYDPKIRKPHKNMPVVVITDDGEGNNHRGYVAMWTDFKGKETWAVPLRNIKSEPKDSSILVMIENVLVWRAFPECNFIDLRKNLGN